MTVGDSSGAQPTASPASTTAPVVAASWRTLAAEGPWLPDPLRDALPHAGDGSSYRDVETIEARACDGPGHDGWQLLGISQRGRVHAHEGTHREDAMAIVGGPHGFCLAAADGAGSSRWSRVASAIVCRTLTAQVTTLVTSGPPEGADVREPLRLALAGAVATACRELQRAAAAAGGATRDLRTTALAALLVGDALATVQVGDGAIVAVARDGRVTRLGAGDAGSYSGEVSAFVPELLDDDIDRRIVVTSVHAIADAEPACILVLTDGVEDPFYPIERRGAEVARQLYLGVESPAEGFRAQAAHGPIVGTPEALARLAEWIAFERRGENDDRTLLGAFRLPPAFHG